MRAFLIYETKAKNLFSRKVVCNIDYSNISIKYIKSDKFHY